MNVRFFIFMNLLVDIVSENNLEKIALRKTEEIYRTDAVISKTRSTTRKVIYLMKRKSVFESKYVTLS